MARDRVVVAALAVCLVLTACRSTPHASPATTSTSVTTTTTTTAVIGTALAALDTIPIKGRAPKTGYARSEFGPAWADVDHNGCDTRNDILQRDLRDIAFRPNTHDCVVISGTLEEPYTGQTMQFD
ncbi:MAG TPA: hypothetical protein VHD87_03485, partial [Acidimicrobiales bacterium]|nr:hypothetical protein [Acidimicrobiales bacterium]